MKKPKITVIGGGTGIPVILKSFRKQDVDLTAIVTVADDGGSSGKLRSALQMTPPGDLRNVLVAMSDMPRFYEEIFQYRFKEQDGVLAGHPLGNLIISGISEMKGSTYNAMRILSKFFHTSGKVYPSSEAALTLHAIFKDGHEVIGESKIADYKGMIDHVFVTNAYSDGEPKASRKVVDTILSSDLVVLGPGSLFTSILPNLMISDIGQALRETKAEIVYICNIMTQRGETEELSDAEHVRIINRHLKRKVIDTVLVNIEKVPQAYKDNNQFDEYLLQVEHDFEGLKEECKRVISANFLRLENGGAFHDGDRIVQELMQSVRVQK